MRAVIQRVTSASVQVNGITVGEISKGLCCLVGIEQSDTEKEYLPSPNESMEFILKKIQTIRLFEGIDGKSWSENIGGVKGGILLISQFTLYAQTRYANSK